MSLDNILNVRYEILLALFALVLISIISSLFKRSRRNFPPGPWGLPIVGYIPFLSKDVHLQFINLSKKYGDVFSLRLGSEVVVVLNDSATIRDAFSKQEFLGRPPNSSFSVFGVKSPFFLNDMHMWQEQRRFVIHSLKDLGLGKTKIEDQQQDEINHFLEVLRSFKGEPIDLVAPLTPSMSNNIVSLIFGKRYDYDEPERKSLDENLEEVSKIIGQTAVHIFFPWIKHIPFLLNWLGLEKGYKIFSVSENIFRKELEEHKKTLDKRNIRDFIDSYLVEMEVRQKKDANTSFTEEVLLGCVSDIFGAGSETVRVSIGWLMYTMAGFPDVQEKVQKEILDVIGPDRNPEYQDQKLMPFSHAVMLEIMRWRTIVPLNILRYTLADTHVAGYDIPVGTIVMANFWAVHHDPKNWEDPDNFKPERFLTPDGKSVVKSPHYMPFSVGKRACPGETMAYMEVFLYFVSILQKFEVGFPEGYKPSFEGNLTLTYKPPSAKISVRFGSEMVVVLNDTASIRDAFSKQEFLGRSPNSSFSVFGKKKPFLLNDLQMWQEHKRFLIHSLKDHAKIEVLLQDEINHFQEVLRSYKSQPIDFSALLTPSLSNNINILIFGKKYDYDEPERITLLENLDKISKIISKEDTLTFFPWLRHLPLVVKWLGFEKNYKLYTMTEEIFRKQVEEHKKTLNKKSIRDFIDDYLVEMEEKQKKDAKTSLIDEALFAIVSGLFSAADETVRTTIGWTIYIMASFLDVQKKVQEEIREVIGLDRNPEYHDQKSMPFSQAVILEVLRWKTTVPLNILRYTLADTNVAGYDIPKGTLVLANFWAVHHDPRYWKDPDIFNPERFLSPDGKRVVKSPHYMPFSIGKRSCPGETMAYMEIFLYFISLVQRFDIRFPEGYEPTFEGNYSITYKPPSANIKFIPRK
ncbi:unnamed protein product [Larinioides sclopetarius]|uniref:Cytochrome P450 2U1 n=1 Tax=Larinioides sclopetarius TaxID=280406 RepID=A0AAV1ZR64_9ARAC